MTIRIFDVQRAANGNRIFDIQVAPAAPPVIVPVPDPEFEAWLKDQHAIRIVLVEADVLSDGVELTRYMAMGGYTTGPTDTPANLHYQPIISVGKAYAEQLSLTSTASLGIGDFEIDNTNSVRESWVRDIWMNQQVRVYLGDPRWSRASFRMISNGISAGLVRKERGKFSLKRLGKMKRLDASMSENKLGGAGPNADSMIPLCFGECFNITPLLVDSALLKYQVHDGAVESIFEVRVNGLPVSANIDNATGTFTLNVPPAGAVTCSVQGDKFGGIYRNTVGALVRRIVTGYGKDDRFTDADIDLANFAAFDASHQQPVGLYVSARTNVIVACRELADSLGTQVTESRLGLLRLIQIAPPSGAGTFTIRPEHMISGTLNPVGNFDPIATIKIGYDRNWTPQPGLVSAISALDAGMYADEWLPAARTNPLLKADLKLSGDAVLEGTLLKDGLDANAEGDRRLALRGVTRTPYEFEGVPEMMSLEIGQEVTVQHPENSMGAGVPAVILTLEPDLNNCHVKVGFLV